MVIFVGWKKLRLRRRKLFERKRLVCLKLDRYHQPFLTSPLARRALADAEKVHADTVADRQIIAEQLKKAEERVHELETKLDEEGRDSSDLEMLRQRVAEDMDDERKQHQQELAERDFTADQTRKKYQSKWRTTVTYCSLTLGCFSRISAAH